MNTSVLKKVRVMFDNENASRHTQRHNIRQWVRSVRMLGDKWVVVRRQEKQR